MGVSQMGMFHYEEEGWCSYHTHVIAYLFLAAEGA